jgi:hypothetical protein
MHRHRGMEGVFPTWKTITLGTHQTPDSLGIALRSAGFKITDACEKILKEVALAPTRTEVQLVNISLGDLGFQGGVHRIETYSRGMELGLELVPAEVGPQLRLQYPDQPPGEIVLPAMEPILGSDEIPRVFKLQHIFDSCNLFLYTYAFRFGADRLVFAKRRNRGQ